MNQQIVEENDRIIEFAATHFPVFHCMSVLLEGSKTTINFSLS